MGVMIFEFYVVKSLDVDLEPRTGFEPATSSLPRTCSTN